MTAQSDWCDQGSLRDRIEALASRLEFPLKKLYKTDGSKRSTHSNAYMYGLFGNKRIVLYDTLLEQCTEDEIVAVLAHELGMSRTANCGGCKALLCSGHWKMSHNLYNFVTLQFILLTQFLLFSLLRTSDDLYVSFGFVEDHPAFISFVLFTFISAPLNEV